MLRHYVALLASAVSTPGAAVRASRCSTRRSANGSSPTGTRPPARRRTPAALPHELFEAQAARPSRPASPSSPGRALAYGELDARANQLAHLLRAVGVGPAALGGQSTWSARRHGRRPARNLKAGAAYVPIDPDWPTERALRVLDPCAATSRVCSPGRAGLRTVFDRACWQLPRPAHLVCLDAAARRPRPGGARRRGRPSPWDNVAATGRRPGHGRRSSSAATRASPSSDAEVDDTARGCRPRRAPPARRARACWRSAAAPGSSVFALARRTRALRRARPLGGDAARNRARAAAAGLTQRRLRHRLRARDRPLCRRELRPGRAGEHGAVLSRLAYLETVARVGAAPPRAGRRAARGRRDGRSAARGIPALAGGVTGAARARPGVRRRPTSGSCTWTRTSSPTCAADRPRVWRRCGCCTARGVRQRAGLPLRRACWRRPPSGAGDGCREPRRTRRLDAAGLAAAEARPRAGADAGRPGVRDLHLGLDRACPRA